MPTEIPGSAMEIGHWTQEAVTSPKTTLQAQMGKVLGYLRGLYATHLIDVGTKLGRFARLAKVCHGLLAVNETSLPRFYIVVAEKQTSRPS